LQRPFRSFSSTQPWSRSGCSCTARRAGAAAHLGMGHAGGVDQVPQHVAVGARRHAGRRQTQRTEPAKRRFQAASRIQQRLRPPQSSHAGAARFASRRSPRCPTRIAGWAGKENC
jgi:hypothetical protein